jgi:hypothetical protein
MPLSAAGPPREMHGSADANTVQGVALAWGVLRGTSEETTIVVVRIVADPAEFGSVAAAGVDPFTRRETSLLSATPVTGMVHVRVPRGQFAEFPRTELRFYGPADAAPSALPKLVVFYLGVPDTTPEFATGAALDAYLADRIARIRASTGSKTP